MILATTTSHSRVLEFIVFYITQAGVIDESHFHKIPNIVLHEMLCNLFDSERLQWWTCVQILEFWGILIVQDIMAMGRESLQQRAPCAKHGVLGILIVL